VSSIPFSLLPDNAALDSDSSLVVGGVRISDIATEFGTPLFVYDEAHLRARARSAVAGFPNGAVYASKAFLCSAMARLVAEEGMRIDVATGGELYVALHAGIPADQLVLHGNNKSIAELEMALDAGVGRIAVDSFEELDRIERLVAGGAEPPKVFIRVTPGVEAHTHEFVKTGQDDSKFGFTVSSGAAATAIERARTSRAMELRGIHAHIGSQVFRVDSFAESLEVLAESAAGLDLPEMVIGGGLGVAYVEGEEAPSIGAWAQVVHDAADRLGITSELWCEPGRAIAASAAITVYTIGTVKRLPGIRTYVAVDGGMSDNPRPVLYGSGYETFLPDRVAEDRTEVIRLVGKHCESGDVLVREGSVPSGFGVGDLIATPVTGAYGHSMGSNYNKVLRPAVVFVADGEARLVVRRETYDDLIATEV
jgi:diaminopimelate decarboxylase